MSDPGPQPLLALHLHAREDRHIDPRASLAAARAACAGIERDTTFTLYPDRGHGLQSTVGSPECNTCPHDLSRFAHGFDLDTAIWTDIGVWLRPRLERPAGR